MIASIIIGLFSGLVLATLMLGLISSVGDTIRRRQQMSRKHLGLASGMIGMAGGGLFIPKLLLMTQDPNAILDFVSSESLVVLVVACAPAYNLTRLTTATVGRRAGR